MSHPLTVPVIMIVVHIIVFAGPRVLAWCTLYICSNDVLKLTKYLYIFGTVLKPLCKARWAWNLMIIACTLWPKFLTNLMHSEINPEECYCYHNTVVVSYQCPAVQHRVLDSNAACHGLAGVGRGRDVFRMHCCMSHISQRACTCSTARKCSEGICLKLNQGPIVKGIAKEMIKLLQHIGKGEGA